MNSTQRVSANTLILAIESVLSHGLRKSGQKIYSLIFTGDFERQDHDAV